MAGTHLPLDRALTAKLLGFARVTPNSLYTANQRGELEIKLLTDLSLLALHIRRTMSEVIIFSSHEFELVKIDDAYTSGGTAQPNLKNPDTLEVVRAKMAGIWGQLVTLMTIMDPLPSGYNRDTQETKPIVFKAVKEIQQAVPVVAGILTSLQPDKQRMLEVAGMNFSVAPDVVIQLAVEKGINFREAYKEVKLMIGKGKKLNLSPKAAALGHVSPGGSAPAEVKKQINELQQQLKMVEEKIGEKKAAVKQGLELLEQEVEKLIAA